jgi:hypothetical protein
MDYREIKKIIEKILWGKSFVEIEDGEGDPHFFILRSLNIRESNLSRYIYDKELKDSIDNGILLKDELVEIYRNNEIWTPAHENRIEEIEKEEVLLCSQIKDLEFFPAKKKILNRKLNSIRKEREELLNEQNNIFYCSAESRAEEIMRRWIVMMSTENVKEQSYWKTEDEFMSESDSDLLYNLALGYYTNNLFEEKIIRQVARSPEWRFRWHIAKNGGDLFGKPIADWSETQNMLIYWSQFYDYVFDSLERPPDHVIENDETCDIWVRDESKRIKSGSSASSNTKKNMFGTKKSAMKKNHQEQFIMVEPGNAESIKRVQEMNPTEIRNQLRRENQVIKEKGRISEWKLRGKSYVNK